MSHDSLKMDFTWQIETLETSLSTNSELKQCLISGDANAGSVLVAKQQTQGRGRFDREWVSPPGNIALSLALPIQNAAKAYQLNLVAGLAAANAIARCGAPHAQIKWPNDVLIGGKKLAGILSEVTTPHLVVIGLGVNLNASRDDFPEPLRDKITTLREHLAHTPTNEVFITYFLEEMRTVWSDYVTKGFAPLKLQIEARLAFRGATASISENGTPPYVATIHGLDDDGFLLVATHDGESRRIVAADIEIKT